MQSFKRPARVARAVPRDAATDPDGALGAASRVVPASPSTSAVVLERSPVGPLSPLFLTGAALLAGGVLALGLALASTGAQTAAETRAGPLLWGLADVDLRAGRAVSAVAAAVPVLCTAIAGRTLTRSGIGGLLAGALVALDPALLAHGRLALPTAVVLAAMAVALACVLAPRAGYAWVGAAALALAAFVDPRAILWGPVLAGVLLLRGHIYASPRHLGRALLQGVLIPAAGVAAHRLVEGSLDAIPACLAPPAWALLGLRVVLVPGPAIAALPNPVTWFAGLGALLFLGFGGVLFAATRFRMARANGRLQVRFVTPAPTVLVRGGWLLLLAVVTFVPQAWVIPFALALALGVQDLGRDAPGFGLTLAIVLLAFAAVVLWGSWDIVTGTGGQGSVADALRIVPWATSVSC